MDSSEVTVHEFHPKILRLHQQTMDSFSCSLTLLLFGVELNIPPFSFFNRVDQSMFHKTAFIELKMFKT